MYFHFTFNLPFAVLAKLKQWWGCTADDTAQDFLVIKMFHRFTPASTPDLQATNMTMSCTRIMLSPFKQYMEWPSPSFLKENLSYPLTLRMEWPPAASLKQSLMSYPLTSCMEWPPPPSLKQSLCHTPWHCAWNDLPLPLWNKAYVMPLDIVHGMTSPSLFETKPMSYPLTLCMELPPLPSLKQSLCHTPWHCAWNYLPFPLWNKA